MIDTFTDKAKTFLQAHSENMKLVERALYFLAIANIALLGFSDVEASVGLALAFSFLFVFFSFCFWWSHSTLEVWNILYEDINWARHKETAANKFTTKNDYVSGFSATCLALCIFSSASFLFLGLLDQFTSEVFLPDLSFKMVLLLFVFTTAGLFALWFHSYLQTTKSLEDYKKAKVGDG